MLQTLLLNQWFIVVVSNLVGWCGASIATRFFDVGISAFLDKSRISVQIETFARRPEHGMLKVFAERMGPMRYPLPLLLAGLLSAGCAWSAPEGHPLKAIDDVEPEVTSEVGAALGRMASDTAAEQGPLLRACPTPIPLELLLRTTKGEERNYLYRARCMAPLLIAVTYGKSATIKVLTINKE